MRSRPPRTPLPPSPGPRRPVEPRGDAQLAPQLAPAGSRPPSASGRLAGARARARARGRRRPGARPRRRARGLKRLGVPAALPRSAVREPWARGRARRARLPDEQRAQEFCVLLIKLYKTSPLNGAQVPPKMASQPCSGALLLCSPFRDSLEPLDGHVPVGGPSGGHRALAPGI